MTSDEQRTEQIITTLADAFEDLQRTDPAAFRVKYRKMARDPHAFYRGTACLFFHDVTQRDDDWADERASAVWIHGDLHVENFGTYLDSDGRMVFDVNDFDEAYLGSFTWDLMRFASSLALLGWQKALPDDEIRRLIGRYLRAYLAQVDHYAGTAREDFSLHLDNTEGPVRDALVVARMTERSELLDSMTHRVDGVRMFAEGAGARPLGQRERAKVMRAFERYLETIPKHKKIDRELFYEVRDVIGRSGFGIGSAGLPAYTVLVEGTSQALDNDVLLGERGLALRGRPRRGRAHRALADGRRRRPPRPRRRRSTAPPTRTATRTSSTSRSRRRSSPRSTAVGGPSGLPRGLRRRVRAGGAARPRALRQRLARGPDRDLRDLSRATLDVRRSHRPRAAALSVPGGRLSLP
ncbi:DUF2252 domain-containing protein [Janibacter melonis]|uniref:DUF2252 domain-containing protein n=1 Tax=Janibacter melonis TaxID=262209 RepID=UPI0021E61F2A